MRIRGYDVPARDLVLWGLFFAVDTVTQLAFKAGGNRLEGLDFGREWLRVAFESPVVWLAIGGILALAGGVTWAASLLSLLRADRSDRPA